MKYATEAHAKALLALGEKPKDISEKTGVAYQKVLALRKQMILEKEKEAVADIVAIDPVAIDIIIEKARDEAPAHVVRKLEKVQEGVSSLQLLDTEFHQTFSTLLKKANSFLSKEGLKPGEWVAITNALSSAYNNIFNNSGVNVHVDNSTKVSSNSLSMFKGSLRE